MKQTQKHLFFLKLSIAALLSAAFVIIAGSQFIEAKSKSTVRVNSEADLIKMLDDSSVGTIIFRSQTYNTVTIPANENAKNKELYIDAQNCRVVNYAIFKNIVIDRMTTYTEKVSGNTIFINASFMSGFCVKDKSTVKNLIIGNYGGFEEENFMYRVEKGSKIKNISYQAVEKTGKKTNWDKTARTLTFNESAYEWGEPVVVTVKFDKAGRITEFKQDFEAEPDIEIYFSYSSLKIQSVKKYSYIEGEKTLIGDSNFDDASNKVTSNFKYLADGAIVNVSEVYRYNKNGRLIKVTHKEDNGYSYTIKYTYDKQDRLKTETQIVGDVTVISKNTYNKKGYLTLVTATSTEFPGKSYYYKYKYDKNGNNIYRERIFYDGTVVYSNDKYDEFGKWLETEYVDENGEVSIFTPDSAG